MNYRCACVSLILLLGHFGSPAQTWEWRNPRPQGDPIEQIFFVDDAHGWMVLSSNNLLRTSDGGATWKVIPIGFEAHTIWFASPLEGWAVGAVDGYSNYVGIYKSTDGGLTWSNLRPDILFLADPTAVHLCFPDVKHGWFGALDNDIIGGVLRSTDGGISWSVQAHDDLRTGLVPRGVWGLAFRDSLRGIVGSTHFSIITTDGGETWRKDSTFAGNYSQFFFTDSLHGWAGDGKIPRRSTDGGLTWTTVASPKSGRLFPLSTGDCFLYGDSVFCTSDTGSTWELRSAMPFQKMAFTSTERGWAARSESDYYQTNDGGRTWARQDTNAFTAQYASIFGVQFLTETHGWVTGSIASPGADTGFVARTTDGGATWQTDRLAAPGADIRFVNEHVGWLIKPGPILKTVDGGLTWQLQQPGVSGRLIRGEFINERIGWIIGDGVLVKTTDGGETWQAENYGVPTYMDEIQFVDSLHGWAAGTSFRSDTYPIYMRTTNGGDSWTQLNPDSQYTVTRVFFRDPANGWGVMTQRQSAAFKFVVTRDGGLTWQEQLTRGGDTRGGLFFSHIAFADSLYGIVAGGLGTFFHTSNGGSTWIEETGMVSRMIVGLSVVNRNTSYLAGWNGMVVRRTGTGPTDVSDLPQSLPLPVDLNLRPPYPNPFNGEIVLSYDLQHPRDVTIEIYDVLGRLLQKSMLGRKEAGSHQIRIDATHFASGVLFFRVTAGNAVATKQGVLIR